MGGLFLDLYIAYVYRIIVRRLRMRRGRSWPATTASVASTSWSSGVLGCPSAELVYIFDIRDSTFGGLDDKPFLSPSAAEAYTLRFARGNSLIVRFKPDDPNVSVVLDRDQTEEGPAGARNS